METGSIGLAIMILGLAAFLGCHAFVTLRAERAPVIKRIGEGPYKRLLSLAALAGIVLISYGLAQYRNGGLIEVWHPPTWAPHPPAPPMSPPLLCAAPA